MSLFGPQYYLTEKSLEGRIATAVKMYYSKYHILPKMVRIPALEFSLEYPEHHYTFVNGEFSVSEDTFRFQVLVEPDHILISNHVWILFENDHEPDRS